MKNQIRMETLVVKIIAAAGPGARGAGVVGAVLLAVLGRGGPAQAAPAAPSCPPKWQIVASPQAGAGTNWLYAVSAVGPTDVWAVGDTLPTTGNTQTLIEHWNGTAWTVVPSPNVPDGYTSLRGVFARTATDVWAAGIAADTTGQHTLIEHWNGRAWTLVPSPNGLRNTSFLTAITASAANDAWAVGATSNGNDNSPAETLTLHWNGQRWTRVDSPNVQWISSVLASVSARSASDVWAVGGGGVVPLAMHWNGRRWTLVNGVVGADVTDSRFLSVAAITANDVWAVGGQTGGQRGSTALLEHWNGRRWTRVALPEADLPPLLSVAAPAANDVWVLTEDIISNGVGESLLLHWDGRRWTHLSTLPGGGVQAITARRGAVWTAGFQLYNKATLARWGATCPP